MQLAPGVADDEIKRAYLRLVSRHHPDKLGPQNLSEEALSAAGDQFAAVHSAYEILCGIRKIRA
ncbi:MAG: DnaJ domain-containing protein [Gammaproteobacteria bacterium]|nr:DnaJ domain-containing protein [Gammaproteobacteria bacterium]